MGGCAPIELKFMDVTLDTNILRQDLRLKSSATRALMDYLHRTNSKILLPQIVYEEIAAIYKRDLVNQIGTFAKAAKALKSHLLSGTTVASAPAIDVEAE